MAKRTFQDKINFFLGSLSLFLVSVILKLNLIVPFFLMSIYVYLTYRKPHLKNYSILNLCFLLVIIVVLSYFIIDLGLSRTYIPFSIIPMLTTILFGQIELSLLMTLAASLTIASIAGNNLHLGILYFTSGIFSSILVLHSRRRITIIRAGFIVGVAQALFLFFIDRFWVWPPRSYSINYLIILINGIVSSIVVLGILPLFESLFRTVTNISLLELADFDHPLLQRLVIEAPGTYHHSLVVGNMSEAACQAIGANALLARIGSYYHDIGKLNKPGYFSENQNLKDSKHDTLSPTMSKLLVINHVKEGVELAKKYRLNPQIIDFIQYHHGTGLVYYFYRRALENLEEDHKIQEEGFRYPGPKPNNKETAIVLLADSAEAATRAIKEPDSRKIEEVVHKIINNKFIDGQLDECDLTLKDLEKISEVFVRILTGIFHSRTNYPEEPRPS
jgi:hypothetical protein